MNSGLVLFGCECLQCFRVQATSLCRQMNYRWTGVLSFLLNPIASYDCRSHFLETPSSFGTLIPYCYVPPSWYGCSAVIHIFLSVSRSLSLEKVGTPCPVSFQSCILPSPITFLLNILSTKTFVKSGRKAAEGGFFFGRGTVSIYPEWKEIHGSQ